MIGPVTRRLCEITRRPTGVLIFSVFYGCIYEQDLRTLFSITSKSTFTLQLYHTKKE